MIPVGARGYELYYETPDAEPAAERAAGMRARLQALLAEAEQRRRDPAVAARAREGAGWIERTKQYLLGWMAERIAEQRLLWHLRAETAVALVYPADLPETEADRLLRAMLQRDETRHGRWLVIHAAAAAVSALLILLPGPNVIGYYFLFMTVSNFLSWRGARRGLRRIAWEGRPSEALVELRHAVLLDPRTRDARVTDVAARLELQHLARFFERVIAMPGA